MNITIRWAHWGRYGLDPTTFTDVTDEDHATLYLRFRDSEGLHHVPWRHIRHMRTYEPTDDRTPPPPQPKVMKP